MFAFIRVVLLQVSFHSNGNARTKTLSVCNAVMSLDNSWFFMFMKEYMLEKILMNGFSIMKPLQATIIFIIMKLFILERSSINVSHVVKPLCYGIPEFQDKSNTRTPQMTKNFVVNFLLINQDHKNILRSLAIDFCLYFFS